MPYSGFFRRAIAFIIDMLIVSLPTLFIFGPVIAFQAVSLGGTPENLSAVQAGILGATLLSWQLVILVLTWLYFAFWESGAKQSTWGKRLLGIKVVGSDGGRISFWRATARFFCKTISYLLFYIGFIMAAFTNRKRALHDMIVETYVVKKDFQPGQELPPTPTHWFWLILVCIVWVLLLLTGAWFSARASLTPTQTVAVNAASRLEVLAKDGRALRMPLRTPNTTYFSNGDGYRAVVVDPISNHKFTLFLQNGATAACCEAFPFGDCASTGFEECK